jgi:hypothetical protein
MISDDDLLLYYYRDGLDASERARIGAALTAQPELAQRLQALIARLDAAAALPDVAVPDEVLQRWQGALASAADTAELGAKSVPRARRLFTDFRWAAAAAVTIALLATIQLTRHTPPPQIAEVAPPTAPAAAGEGNASSYERSLRFHLASTERSLAGLENAKPEERARLVETIIEQNRLYALAAERAGEPQLARVLRAFSPILESLEHGGESSASSVARLGFELRVMQGRLSADAGVPANTSSTTL